MKSRPLLELLAVVVGFSALTAAILYPLPFALSTLAYNPENGDGQFSVWNVAWVARTLLVDPRHVFDANIFYPHRWTLAYSEMNLAAGAIAVPVYWLTKSAYAAANFALLVSFVLSATAMYYLCRELTGDRRAAIVGAVLFSYCSFVFAHLLHTQLLMTAGLPLSMLAFHRLLDQPTPRRGAMLGMAMAFQALACAYYSVFVVLIVGTAALLLLSIRGAWTDRRIWTAFAAGAAVAIVGALPAIMGFLALRDTGYERPLAAARQYSADWRAYFASGHSLHGWMLGYLGGWREVLFPGFLAIAASAGGTIFGWRAGGVRRQVVLLYAAIVALALWASFGPDAGLYSLLYYVVPLFSVMRAPVRFGLVVLFGLSVLASMGVAQLLARRIYAPALAAVLIAVAIAESWIVVKFDAALQPHSGYYVLAAMPSAPVLELPVYSRRLGFRRSRYMLDSTVHWMPLVDAYSDSIPSDFDQRSAVLANFPSEDSLRDMKRDQVRYAVIHLSAYDDPTMRQSLFDRLAQFAQNLREVYRADDLLIVEVTRYID